MAENQWNDEFREPEQPFRRPDPTPDQWGGEAPPPKAGMSGGMKAFLIIVAILGTGCVLCCGVVGFFAYQMVPKISQNPAEVNAARDEIAKIELPAGFQPVTMFKMDNFFMNMTAVEYRDSAIDGRFSMAEMQLKVGEPAQRDQAMRQQLEKQGIGTPKTLRNAKSETKSIEIKGQECSFAIKRGEDPVSKKKICQVAGLFTGKRGPVWLSLEMDNQAFKEDAIVKMLEEIK
jgi:hypothetical protein